MTPLDSAVAYVVGTAGHIDHGKSTLVQALTGIDPDRLEEEKRRGMTIDLGFAYMDLPSGRHLGIVDVPGHQRFLKNMLAGVHGIDAVLFVVAADEGPMPQTMEHLAILDLLGVGHGVIALTKSDLVDEEWQRLVTEEVRALARKSVLREAPIVPVSAVTGSGLDALRAALDAALAEAPPRPDLGRPRLPVDRSFAMAGFGTVVTGTLIGGALKVGDELAVYPAGRSVRVRGLQQHNRSVLTAGPGNRTAVNLVGVERKQVARGDVLAPRSQLAPTRRIDARLTVLSGSSHPIRHRGRFLLYLGTSEVVAEVLLLEADELNPGTAGWAQLYAERPLVAVPADRFILRRPAPGETVAGGVVVDANPRRHRRKDTAVIAELEGRQRGDPASGLAVELRAHPMGVTVAELGRRLVLDAATVEGLGQQLAEAGSLLRVDRTWFARDVWDRLARRAAGVVDAYHRAHPLREGMPREELRSRIGLSPALTPAAVAQLVRDGILTERGAELALPGHRAELTADQEKTIEGFLRELEATPFAPPSLTDLAARYRLTPALVQYLQATGRIVRVNEDTAFSFQAYEDAVGRIKAHLQRDGKLSVAQARDLLGSSRRYVLPLLEWLDAQKVTRRVGDDRILRV